MTVVLINYNKNNNVGLKTVCKGIYHQLRVKLDKSGTDNFGDIDEVVTRVDLNHTMYISRLLNKIRHDIHRSINTIY